MANTPLNGTLLRRVPGADNGAGLNDAKEWWYDPNPLVRAAAVYVVFKSADFSTFLLPANILLDRWCVSIGSAPYTEITVFNQGITGAVYQVSTDNVMTCQCTIGFTATVSAVVNGRADITAVATNPIGAVKFSLDNFDSPGLNPIAGLGNPTIIFPQLVTGTYTVTVKETRPLGCSASQTLTFAAVYAPRYNLAFRDLDNVACQLQIFEREYIGPVIQLTAAAAPVKLDWSGGALDHVYSKLIKGSSAELGLYVTAAEPLNALFSGDERLHRIDVSRAGALIWRGFLLPEQYDVMHLAGTSGVTLTATDGLGTLSTVPFAGPSGKLLRGDWTLIQVVQFCLSKLSVGLPLDVLFNLFPAGSTYTTPAGEQIRVDIAAYADDKGTPWDCNKVLAELMLPFAARLYQMGGTWRLERIVELTTAPLAMMRYAPDTYTNGTLQPAASVIATIGTSGNRPYWQGATQRQSLRGAVASVKITNAPGKVTNLLKFAQPANTDLPGMYPLSWSGFSPKASTSFAQLRYIGPDKPPVLRLVGNVGASLPAGTPYASTAARNADVLSQSWVQTPPTRAVPGPSQSLQNRNGEALVIRGTITPYGNEPQTSIAVGSLSNPFVYFALHFGANWMWFGDATQPESATVPVFFGVEILDTKAFDFTIPGYITAQIGSAPAYVRIIGPLGGTKPGVTADITNLSLAYEASGNPLYIPYTTNYKGDTRQLVSRTDAATTLFYTDTPAGRYDGSLLRGDGRPALQWATPTQPDQYREVGDYLTAARLAWQLAPAQTLSGTLRGAALGVGSLLTDPQEQFQGVYILTAAAYDVAEASWQVAGVQLLPLTPDTQTAPANAIAYEDITTFWADEAGVLLTYDA